MSTTKLTALPISIVFFFLFSGCAEENTEWKSKVADPSLLHACVDRLTETIVYDVFSPPVSSRVYMYPSVAAYEAFHYGNSEKQLSKKLKGFDISKLDVAPKVCREIASHTAFLETCKALIFSESQITNYQDSIHQFYLNNKVPADVISASEAFGKVIAENVLAWAGKDNYKESRSFQRYSPIQIDSAYALTPPDYQDALEPNWHTIRPLIMDSVSQFMPVRPLPYSNDTSSEFYKQVFEVYKISQTLTEEEKAIAKFWDNNPFINEHHGHMMIGVKKVGPPGHWLGIAGMACKHYNTNFEQTVSAYAYTSIAFFEAFLSAFDEKYRSHYIRPETYINRHIDASWQPYIHTPPFPEYPSAHSVTSGAAATILTQLFGNDFAFTDSVEVPFGQKPRELPNFLAAAQEASMSRLYGGIHYLASLDNGNLQGRMLGAHIIEKLEIAPIATSSSTSQNEH